MSISEGPQGDSVRSRLQKASQVIIVSSVMFTFISYWRTAAIVLSDLGSTAYYIGGIVEQAIGPAAPWFILAVMLFSYAVRSVYIESVSLFVRGGVYRVTREALGGLAAKVAVSALLFDYVLTGPISSVAAGQYIMGLLVELSGSHFLPSVRTAGAVLIAVMRHGLFLPSEPAGDPRIQWQGAEDHGGHHGDGRRRSRLVLDHASDRRARTMPFPGSPT